MKKYSQFIIEKARPPKLRGRDKKAAEAKSQIMKQLNTDSTFNSMKEKIKRYAQQFAKKKASELGISPTLINLDKIKI